MYVFIVQVLFNIEADGDKNKLQNDIKYILYILSTIIIYKCKEVF